MAIAPNDYYNFRTSVTYFGDKSDLILYSNTHSTSVCAYITFNHPPCLPCNRNKNTDNESLNYKLWDNGLFTDDLKLLSEIYDDPEEAENWFKEEITKFLNIIND